MSFFYFDEIEKVLTESNYPNFCILPHNEETPFPRVLNLLLKFLSTFSWKQPDNYLCWEEVGATSIRAQGYSALHSRIAPTIIRDTRDCACVGKIPIHCTPAYIGYFFTLIPLL